MTTDLNLAPSENSLKKSLPYDFILYMSSLVTNHLNKTETLATLTLILKSWDEYIKKNISAAKDRTYNECLENGSIDETLTRDVYDIILDIHGIMSKEVQKEFNSDISLIFDAIAKSKD